MRSVLALCSALLALAGCGAGSLTDPYFLPFDPPLRGYGPAEVSICYNSNTTTPERVRAMIAQNCHWPVLMANRPDTDRCSILSPVRAIYACERISPELASQRPMMKHVGSWR